MADIHHLGCDSEHGVDTVGIYVINNYIKNRECSIWILLDNMKLGEKGSLLLLVENILILKSCPLEESASHHARMLSCTPARMHACTHARNNANTHARMHECMHVCMHARMYLGHPCVAWKGAKHSPKQRLQGSKSQNNMI